MVFGTIVLCSQTKDSLGRVFTLRTQNNLHVQSLEGKLKWFRTVIFF